MPHPLLDTIQTSVQPECEHGEIDRELKKRTDRRRKGIKIAAKLRRAGLVKRADRMEGCGRSFIRATCIKCGTVQTFSQAYNCQDRLCPSCASKRSAKMAGKWKRALEAFQAQREGLHAYFFTLTFRDHDKLHSFGTYTKARRKLFKHPFWKEYGLVGGIAAFELKIGEGSNLWHPHFHCILFTQKEMECVQAGERKGHFELSLNQEISDMWQTLTGDSYIVDGCEFDGNTRELTKYITKSGDELTDKRLAELATWAKGKRFVSTFGACYNNAAMREAMKEDPLENGKLHVCDCGGRDFAIDGTGWSDRLNEFVMEYHHLPYHLDEPPDDSPGET